MKIRWSQGALEDLAEICRYIAMDRAEAADDTALRIIDAVSQLEQFPSLGKQTRQAGIRELALARSPYIVDYDLGPEEVAILRIRHGARSFPQR